MEITLHKASVLQGEIREIVNNYNAVVRSPAITVSIYDTDVTGTIATARAKLCAAREKVKRLTEALYAIRSAAVVANAESGVSAILTDIALIESEMSYAKAIVSYPVSRSLAEVTAEIAAETTKSEGMSYRSGSKAVIVNMTSSEDVAEAEKTLLECRRKLRRQRDEVSRLNAVTKIKLSDEVAETLKGEGLF